MAQAKQEGLVTMDLVSAERAGRIIRPNDLLSPGAARQRLYRAGVSEERGYPIHLVRDLAEQEGVEFEWLPAAMCPENGEPVMVRFEWESNLPETEPSVARRLGPGLWCGIDGGRFSMNPETWRPMTRDERYEMGCLFPHAMPSHLKVERSDG